MKKWLSILIGIFLVASVLSPVVSVQAKRPTPSPTQTPNPTQPGNEVPSETEKWVVCRVPYGNPNNAHYIWVALEAIEHWNDETHSGDVVWGPVGEGAPKQGTKCSAPAPLPTPTVIPTHTPTPVITKTQSSDLSQTPTAGSSSCAELFAYDQDNLMGGTDIVVRSVTRSGGLPVFGKEVFITPQTGYTLHPSIDPNGSCRLAYQFGSDYPEIHIMNVNGTGDKKIVMGSQPDWGFGGFLIYVDSDGYIVRIDESGKNPVLLAFGRNPKVSPSGQWVAYETRSHTLGLVWSMGISEASALNIKNNGRFETSISCLNPTWDPDGSGIVCATTRGLEYITGTFQTILYTSGIDIELDPTVSTLHAVVIETIGEKPTQAWVVPHYFALADLKSLTGTSLGQWISNPNWWSPESPIVIHDLFMDAFTK